MHPKLRSKDAITDEEEGHGEKEHAEGNAALLCRAGRIENVKRLVQKALDSGILGGEQD